MSGYSAKVREKAQSQGKIGNMCNHGYLIVTPWQYAGTKTDVHRHMLRTSYNVPVCYSYFNAFCISDVQHFELTLVSC